MPQPPSPRISHIHMDAGGGAAGDMFVAAILSALPWLRDRVLADGGAVLPPPLRPFLRNGTSGGLAVVRFGLEGVIAAGGHGHGHHAVGYPALCARIAAAALQPGTSREALGILRLMAEAESAMHAVPVEEVHFHELADWDSLLDVVAAGSIAAALDGTSWTVSDLPLGGGMVETRHGLLPVPAPATAAILRGFRWRDDGIAGERVTPTGAAILAHLVRDPAAPRPAGSLAGTGMGAGTRELPGVPNVLRAMAFGQAASPGDTVAVLEFDVDDMTGEEIGIAADRLRAFPGVLDVTVGTRSGKKGRPVADFRVMALPAALQEVADRCFLETSTIGLRHLAVPRMLLRRDPEQRDGERGKRVRRPGGTETVKIESDELAALDTLAARRARRAKWEAE